MACLVCYSLEAGSPAAGQDSTPIYGSPETHVSAVRLKEVQIDVDKIGATHNCCCHGWNKLLFDVDMYLTHPFLPTAVMVVENDYKGMSHL